MHTYTYLTGNNRPGNVIPSIAWKKLILLYSAHVYNDKFKHVRRIGPHVCVCVFECHGYTRMLYGVLCLKSLVMFLLLLLFPI